MRQIIQSLVRLTSARELDSILAFVGVLVVVALWIRSDDLYRELQIGMAVAALLAIDFPVPWILTALLVFWLSGIITLTWCHEPGSTIQAFLWQWLLALPLQVDSYRAALASGSKAVCAAVLAGELLGIGRFFLVRDCYAQRTTMG